MIRLVGEIGYQYFHSQENEWVVGVLGAVEASDKLELLAEVRSYSETFPNRGDVILNLGLRRSLGSKVKLLASAGTGLTSGQGTTSLYRLSRRSTVARSQVNERSCVSGKASPVRSGT